MRGFKRQHLVTFWASQGFLAGPGLTPAAEGMSLRFRVQQLLLYALLLYVLLYVLLLYVLQQLPLVYVVLAVVYIQPILFAHRERQKIFRQDNRVFSSSYRPIQLSR